MFKKNLLVVLTSCLIISMHAYAFGVDVCFNDPSSGETPIRNCIDVSDACRTSNLSVTDELTCRINAVGSGVSGLFDGNAIIGGRSLIHSDSTYVMAQMIGFSAWEAYQMMIYSEATDQSEYTPFDQTGKQILSDAEIAACHQTWGKTAPNACLLITPELNGISKFNYYTGGMLLHLHARFSSDENLPPEPYFPADYFSSTHRPYEKLLTNFRAWVFNTRPDACAAGITQEHNADTAACEQTNSFLKSPMNFFALGFSKLAIPFVTKLGTLIIEEYDNDEGVLTHVLANDASFQNYIKPHDVAYAKAGIFVHALADRYSHHMCTDHSYFYQLPDGEYNSHYSSLYCAQGSHFLWHAWEQGTIQTNANLETQHQTMRPALEAVYDQLQLYAKHTHTKINPLLDKEKIINDLIHVLEKVDPKERLDSMVGLMEDYKLLPLPGHGSAAKLSLDAWLKKAGAPV
jgi:hypothetical protein